MALACSSANHGSDSDQPTKANREAAGDYCEIACAKQKSCDQRSDDQTCRNSCTNELAALGPKLRIEYLDGTSSCINDADCASVLDGSAPQKCSRQAVASLAPSAAGTAFCDGYAAALMDCRAELDKAACFELVKTFNDAALSDASRCLEHACSTMTDCVAAALGGTSGSDGAGSSQGGAGNEYGSGPTPPEMAAGAYPDSQVPGRSPPDSSYGGQGPQGDDVPSYGGQGLAGEAANDSGNEAGRYDAEPIGGYGP